MSSGLANQQATMIKNQINNNGKPANGFVNMTSSSSLHSLLEKRMTTNNGTINLQQLFSMQFIPKLVLH